MGDYANFINTGHRNFIRVLIPHQILWKIRIYGFLWHPMSSSMQLWNVSPPECLISRSKDFKTIGPDALIRLATHGGQPVGWKKIRVDRPLELLSTDGDFLPRSSSYAWLPMSLSHIGSEVKRRQSQSYKFKNFTKISNFWILKRALHVTHLLKLLDKMCKYEMDPMSIVEDTERTRFCPQTDRRTRWYQYIPLSTSSKRGV